MLHFNYTVGRTSLHRCCRACCCSPRIFSGEESVQICRNEQTHPPCVNSCAQQFSMGDKHISFASGRFLVFCSGDQLDGICEQTSAWISGLTDANLLPIDSVSTPPPPNTHTPFHISADMTIHYVATDMFKVNRRSRNGGWFHNVTLAFSSRASWVRRVDQPRCRAKKKWVK